MRVVVTGGSGFIGSNFIHYWMATHPDDTVINVDKLTYAANQATLKSFDGNERYVFEHVDIAEDDQVDRVFATHNPDLVVHFAAESHVDRSITDRGVFVRTNVVGTQVLLDASLKHQVAHFHHISTDEVFGAIGETESRKFDETTAYDPRNPYSASKAGSDHLVRAYNRTFGLRTTITNCSNNYGPYQLPEKMISLAITNVFEGKKIPIYGTGHQSRDWLYVEDHCRAVDVVIDNGESGVTYCVGGAHDEVSNLEIAHKICAILGKDPDSTIEFVPDRPGHDFKYVVDWSRIRDGLGWAPTRSLDQGLTETVKWYDENREWWEHSKSNQATFNRVTV